MTLNKAILCLGIFLTTYGLFAEQVKTSCDVNQEKSSSVKCPCGCNCDSNCNCGCIHTGKCLCEHKEKKEEVSCAYSQPERECAYAHACGHDGIWFPETCVLFRPFIADPRAVEYSIGWRNEDRVFDNNLIDVSFGDIWGIYQWCHVGPWNGQMRIELEGAVWALFAPLKDTSPMINSDWYVGIPLTYAFENWSFRLRAFHISSHIGDEFLIDHKRLFRKHKNFHRKNPSAEYLDFFVSNEDIKGLRLFAGLGWMIFQDETFKCSPFYGAAGWEWRIEAWRKYNFCSKLSGVPFFASYFRFSKDFKNYVDTNLTLGYEWSKLTGLCRRLRLYLEYHNGNSLEGQFCKLRTDYVAIRASYGF